MKNREIVTSNLDKDDLICATQEIDNLGFIAYPPNIGFMLINKDCWAFNYSLIRAGANSPIDSTKQGSIISFSRPSMASYCT